MVSKWRAEYIKFTTQTKDKLVKFLAKCEKLDENKVRNAKVNSQGFGAAFAGFTSGREVISYMTSRHEALEAAFASQTAIIKENFKAVEALATKAAKDGTFANCAPELKRIQEAHLLNKVVGITFVEESRNEKFVMYRSKESFGDYRLSHRVDTRILSRVLINGPEGSWDAPGNYILKIYPVQLVFVNENLPNAKSSAMSSTLSFANKAELVEFIKQAIKAIDVMISPQRHKNEDIIATAEEELGNHLLNVIRTMHDAGKPGKQDPDLERVYWALNNMCDDIQNFETDDYYDKLMPTAFDEKFMHSTIQVLERLTFNWFGLTK